MSRPISVVAAGSTDIGRRREHNEDAILVRPDLGLYVVADGAGGHNAGNVASALALAVIANYFEATEHTARDGRSVDRFGLRTGARRLACAIQKANRDVVEISRASPAHQGMGSTVVALTIDPFEPVVHIAHVGDSRCYRLRGPHLERMTHDHSLLNDVLSLKPDLPDKALARLPRKVVTRALGMEDSVRVSVLTFDVADGDSFLLCSDGLTGEVDDADIRGAILRDPDPNEVVPRLIELANEAGGNDNIAAVFVRCATRGLFERRPMKDSWPPESGELSDPSSPEILLLGGARPAKLASPADLRTVPAESASQSLLDALGTFMARGETAPTILAERACPKCSTKMLLEEPFCPECGSRLP